MRDSFNADRVIAAVYESYDYSKFKKLDNNRDVTERRKDKLIASISGKYILNPIVVNKNFEIIDGQGRYEALKELGLPIIYVIDEDADIDDCRRMNSYNTSRSESDFVKSYAPVNDNYKNLEICHEETSQPYTRIMRMVNRGSAVKAGKNVIKTGKAIFTEEDIKSAEHYFQLADEIYKALAYGKRRNDAFYVAVKVIADWKGYNHQRMLRNCELNRNSYAQMANASSQIDEFERIYNYNTKSRKNRLYFSDYNKGKGYDIRNYEFSNHDKSVQTLGGASEWLRRKDSRNSTMNITGHHQLNILQTVLSES